MSADFLHAFLEPWYESLENPSQAQQKVLATLLQGYAKTTYGQDRRADKIASVEEFRRAFPSVTYRQLLPELELVRHVGFRMLLPEPVVGWVMTRGSTGRSKIIPVTQTHLDQVLLCGARSILNFSYRRRDTEILEGSVLNLNFPSVVSSLETSDGPVPYGYGSGTYARMHPGLASTGLIPRQEEIDALGGGIRSADWKQRFELVYQRAKNASIRAVMGVAPVIRSFARHVKWVHGVFPRQLWKLKALFLTSVAKIHTRYAPALRAMYGDVPVVEVYSATEGVFGQQLDDLPYFAPNFDTYLFEVRTGAGFKMLHELKRGERGRLVVSSCLFPRYEIGDLIECLGKYYYRVFGRSEVFTLLEHYAYRFVTRWFIR